MRLKEKKEIINILKETKLIIETLKYEKENNSLNNTGFRNIINDMKKNIKDISIEFNIEYIELLINELDKTNYKDKKFLDKCIKKIEEMIKDIEIKVKPKIKVVFLPYKASMWTSLESIWKAASEDDECEATIVPIPYHELDSQGNEIRICYEGNLYSKDIPIKKFWEYHICDEKPDMIFIHNPYDKTNGLTRVPEEYYSENLKKYTDMLVYSPYHTFITYDKTSHFCSIEGTKNVDKILAQSTKLKKQYILNGHESEKILEVGSPKIDSIYNSLKNPPSIPYEWQQTIKNKKVFLLCTTLSFLTRFKDIAIERIKNVYNQVTKEENCVLIWRPHPLQEIYIENKMPEFLSTYRDIKLTLQHDENVIIDESWDYRQSFSIAEGMFCSYTSLINEFMVTGKPVYILQGYSSSEDKFLVSYNENYYLDRWSIRDFTRLALEGNDAMKEERMRKLKNSFINIEDGSCGKKTYEIIKKEIVKKGL